jgi:ParB family chromosome partitioning protein
MSDTGDLESAQFRIRPTEKKGSDELLNNLETAVEAMKNVPWTTLQELRGDSDLMKKLEDAENLLKSLRKALT